MEVKRALERDVGLVAPLFDEYRIFYGQAPDVGRARSFLEERLRRGQSVVFVAMDGGEALGFTQLYPSFSSVRTVRTFILNDMFVRPSSRRRRVGAALLETARDHAIEHGGVQLSLTTGVGNLTAQALYEAAGWTRDVDFLTYVLELPAV